MTEPARTFSFRPGQLRDRIVAAGMSYDEFATLAGIDLMTLRRARDGGHLKPKTFGRILIALAHAESLGGSQPPTALSAKEIGA